jgi:hypothetical protein
MSIEQRQSVFESSLSPHLPKNPHISPCYGTANIARMVPGGIVLAVTNLANYSNESGPLCLVSRICLLPNAELYFCAVIQNDKQALLTRLKEMLEANVSGDSNFSRENNNTSVCVAKNQQLYFYNKKISEIESPVQRFLGNPIAIDKFYYSIYSPNSQTTERTILRSLVSGVAAFVGEGKVVELDTWGQFNLLPNFSNAGATTLSNAVKDFSLCAKASGLQISHALASRLIASLLAKRFVILSGLAGSGKTKLADALAMWLCADHLQQTKLIPVGADWTNNENLLGYADALHSGKYCTPPSGALDLIIAAEKDKTQPFFLILDEMNLSHVERYFSDMLSAIESGKDISLHNEPSGLEGIPATILLPENLFIIGTINVDETTYMFSPKVLDRANVIEFRATAEQIGIFLDAPEKIRMHEIEGKGAKYGESFVAQAGCSDTLLSSIPILISGGVDLSAELKTRLLEAFEALAAIGAEFGFRTAHEISRFVYFHAILTGPGWKFEEALDAQVLQKLLPKLHGSERRLGPVLKQLRAFCDKYDLLASKEKIDRMADRLKDGFTSFAEA